MLTFRRLVAISRPIFYIPSLVVYFGGFALSCLLAHEFNFDWRVIAGAVFFTVCMSFVGYGLNDIADRDSDARNARKGGMDGVVLSVAETKRLYKMVVWVTIVSLLLLLVTRSFGLFYAGLAVYAFAYTYSVPPVRLKTRPILDSLSNGFWIVSVFLGGFWATTTEPAVDWPPAFLLAAIFLATSALHALFAVIDHDADKAAGDRTISVALGKRLVLVLCSLAFFVTFLLIAGSSLILGSLLLIAALLCLDGLRDSRPAHLRRSAFFLILSSPAFLLAYLIWN